MIFDVYEFDLTHKVKACLFEIDCESLLKKKIPMTSSARFWLEIVVVSFNCQIDAAIQTHLGEGS